jgi:hypothetical protein
LLALRIGLIYAVTPVVVPVEDTLCGVEKALDALPEGTAEKTRQETVRIINGSRKSKDKVTIAKSKVLGPLKPMRRSPSFQLTRAKRSWYWILQTTIGRSLPFWRTTHTGS